MKIIQYGNHLSVLHSPIKFNVASWAPINGGITSTNTVFNKTLKKRYWNKSPNSVQRILNNEFNKLKFDFLTSVGMLTAVPQEYFGHHSQSTQSGMTVNCFVTAGICNDSLSDAFDCSSYDEEFDQLGPEPHTINVICWVNRHLSHGAMLEALNQIAHAKMAALIDRQAISPKSGRQALCTGTDCSAFCCLDEDYLTLKWAGPFSVLGGLIAETTYSAIQSALTHKHGPLYKEPEFEI